MSNERELGLGLQTDKALSEYGPLARAAEEGGFDVVTTFNDLWFQPSDESAFVAKRFSLPQGSRLRYEPRRPSVPLLVGTWSPRSRSIARREVAIYLGVVTELDPTFSVDLEQLAGGIPDDVLDRFAFAGTPEQVAAHAEAVFEAGAGRIDFGTPHGVPEPRGIELLCTQVLPRLR